MKSVTYLLDELVVPQFEIPRVSHRLHHGSTPLRFQTDARPTSSLSSRDLRLTIQSLVGCIVYSGALRVSVDAGQPPSARVERSRRGCPAEQSLALSRGAASHDASPLTAAAFPPS
jgi:hypothetical protein